MRSDEEVIATYRNHSKAVEIEIVRDNCASWCPLDKKKDWLLFPALADPRFQVGTEVSDEDSIRECVRKARASGGIGLPVDLHDDGNLEFRAENGDYDGGHCGALVATGQDLRRMKLDLAAARHQAVSILKRYTHWANGHGFGYAVYEVHRCSLGHWHRTGKTVEHAGGYLGTKVNETDLLQDAGVYAGKPPRMGADWTLIAGV